MFMGFDRVLLHPVRRANEDLPPGYCSLASGRESNFPGSEGWMEEDGGGKPARAGPFGTVL
jgi:hypothetical protein